MKKLTNDQFKKEFHLSQTEDSNPESKFRKLWEVSHRLEVEGIDIHFWYKEFVHQNDTLIFYIKFMKDI